MATDHDNAFSVLGKIEDDSRFVYEAMASLGMILDFSELNADEMSLVLALAAYLKRAQGRADQWES